MGKSEQSFNNPISYSPNPLMSGYISEENLSLLKNYKNTKIIFGVIKIASSNIETVEEIENRMKETLKFISKEQLIAAPDCGLGHLSRELAMKKLKTMSLAAKKFNEAELLFPQSSWAPKSALMAAYSYYSQDYYFEKYAPFDENIKS